MSRATELAKAEADAVEAAEPDEPTPDEPTPDEPTPEPPPAEPVADEAVFAKAEKVIESKKKALSAILGDDALKHDCLLCRGLGYLGEFPPVGTTFEVAAVEEGVVLNFYAPADLSMFAEAPDQQMCDWCQGRGQTRTGALTEHGKLWQCTKCNGQGFVMKSVEPVGTIYVPPVVGSPAPLPPNGTVDIPADAWGRPFGHGHYGIPPASIEAAGA